jgi:hypothetical protein
MYPADLAATTPTADGPPYGNTLGEGGEIPANEAHNEHVDHH